MKTILPKLILILPLAMTIGCATSVHAADRDFTAIKQRIDSWVEKEYYAGAGLLIAKDGQVVYEKYFGEYGPETVVYIASAGKWLAAATIAAVVEDTRLSWDDPVNKWLPEFTDVKGTATLRQLLSHTSGFPDYHKPPHDRDTYQSLIESVREVVPLEAVAEPGLRFEYGGLAMQVAGRMAELAQEEDWETIFQDKIARPLRMKDTHFVPVDTAPGHAPMLGGAARTTLRDYGNFLSMMYHGGVFEGRRVLSRESIAYMQADHVRGATIIKTPEFVEVVRGKTHNGLYGLGEWREIIDGDGQATLISSPSWAGAYPWIDKASGIYGFFLAHVNAAAAERDGFSAFYSSPALATLSKDALNER